jgi:hypothetical protein
MSLIAGQQHLERQNVENLNADHFILTCIKHDNILDSLAIHTLPFCLITSHPSGHGSWVG